MKTISIAERKVILEKEGQNDSVVTIRIGAPYRVDDVQWSCPVALEGLYERLADISGVDSFQCLMLAQKVIRTLLEGVVEEGT
jgi:hypothetical protein